MSLVNVKFDPVKADLPLEPYGVSAKFTLFPGNNFFSDKGLAEIEQIDTYQSLFNLGVLTLETVEPVKAAK